MKLKKLPCVCGHEKYLHDLEMGCIAPIPFESTHKEICSCKEYRPAIELKEVEPLMKAYKKWRKSLDRKYDGISPSDKLFIEEIEKLRKLKALEKTR